MPDTLLNPITDATTITKQPQPRSAVPAINHAEKARALTANWAARATGNAAATAQLAGLGLDAQDWMDLLDLQLAAWQRLGALQQGWVESYKTWMKYAGQVKGANTISKLVERECNIGAQLTQLIGSQITDLVTLEENFEIDFSYWVAQALAEKRKDAPWFMRGFAG